jgi:hypothetical protein
MALRHLKLEIDIASVTFLYEPFYAGSRTLAELCDEH